MPENSLDRIDHFVVLMLENRSFDHALGFVKRRNPEIDGLDGTESNPDLGGNQVQVRDDATHRDPICDPGHEFADVYEQVFGDLHNAEVANPPMSGFVRNFQRKFGTTQVMTCFGTGGLPVLETLALEFAVCDRWFSSVPGPTWPNRLFLHAASSDGYVHHKRKLYGMRTLFNNLLDAGNTCRIYAGDFPQSLLLRRLVTTGVFRHMDSFWADLAAGALPNYSVIEPAYFGEAANDQHPPHDVIKGESLIANVYEALRKSEHWERSMLIVLYDEHGGLYDHVPPGAAVPPGQSPSRHPPFRFDRYGVRVPAVLVSPYIPRGLADHRTYDHTSIPATIKKRFGLSFLTDRDRHANTFDNVLSLGQPRSETPGVLPRASRIGGFSAPSGEPLNDLQRQLVGLATLIEGMHARAGLAPARRARAAPVEAPANAADARAYVTWVYATEVLAGDASKARSRPLKSRAPRRRR